MTGRPWLRSAGWLVLLPPLFFVHEVLLVMDSFNRGGRAWRVVEASFGFWQSGVPVEYRLQAAARLLLFLAAAAVGLIAAFGGIGKIATMVLAAAQALVCPLGIVWDYRAFDPPPAAIRKLPVPVPGGRATCTVYLLLAIAAFVLALVDRRRPAPAVPHWSPASGVRHEPAGGPPLR